MSLFIINPHQLYSILYTIYYFHTVLLLYYIHYTIYYNYTIYIDILY